MADTIAEAERLGFDSVWTAEAYGSDVLTPLAWWGAATEKLRLGTALVQMSARTPAATAMAAMTMDHLSGRRFVLGMGVSGPQAGHAARRGPDDFEVAAAVPLIVHDDVEQAADMLRPMYALYFGGMGARGRNFHHDVAVRMGYADEAKRIQDLYLDGKKPEAAAAVPTQLVEELALIGPVDKVRHDLEAWRESIATTLLIGGDAAMVRQAAELVLG